MSKVLDKNEEGKEEPKKEKEGGEKKSTPQHVLSRRFYLLVHGTMDGGNYCRLCGGLCGNSVHQDGRV